MIRLGICHPENHIKPMHVKRSLIVAFSLFCLLFVSSSTLACACCAEHGTYDLSTVGIDSYKLGLLKEIKFDKTFELYMTEAGFDNIRGLSSIEADFKAIDVDHFDLVDTFTNNAWTMKITSPGGKAGTLVLPRPSSVTIFRVDQHKPESGEGETVLYKEFRLTGTVRSGSGFLRSSIVSPTSYTLVFQGIGNMCDSSSDFTHWHLDVKGAKAKYSFFGKLKTTS